MLDDILLDREQQLRFKKVKRQLVLIFAPFLVLTAISLLMNIFATGLESSIASTLRFIAILALIFLMMKGKEWAGGVLTFIICWAIAANVIWLIGALQSNLIEAAIYIIIIIAHAFPLYYINANKNFQEFFKYQRNLNKNKKVN